MLELREIRLSDKEWVRELLSYSGYRGCEYTFGNNYIWRDAYNIQIGRFQDFYIVKSEGHFIFPAGKGDVVQLIDCLKEYCAFHDEELYFSSSDKSAAELLKTLYENEVEITSNPDYYDYIYNRDDLAYLIGKKYHSKRNFVNRFGSLNWSYEPITPENISECRELNVLWRQANSEVFNSSMESELKAAENGLNSFFELDFTGGLLRVDGKAVAYTFGERINNDTIDVHVEKALTDISGTYPMINQQYVIANCKDFTYINREEDLGEENLRKAKKSYHPAFMQEKFQIRFKQF